MKVIITVVTELFKTLALGLALDLQRVGTDDWIQCRFVDMS